MLLIIGECVDEYEVDSDPRGIIENRMAESKMIQGKRIGSNTRRRAVKILRDAWVDIL